MQLHQIIQKYRNDYNQRYNLKTLIKDSFNIEIIDKDGGNISEPLAQYIKNLKKKIKDEKAIKEENLLQEKTEELENDIIDKEYKEIISKILYEQPIQIFPPEQQKIILSYAVIQKRKENIFGFRALVSQYYH